MTRPSDESKRTLSAILQPFRIQFVEAAPKYGPTPTEASARSPTTVCNDRSTSTPAVQSTRDVPLLRIEIIYWTGLLDETRELARRIVIHMVLFATGQPGTETQQISSPTTSVITMRFWVEAGLAASSGFLAILTLFTRDWIEALAGFDLDNNNGSFEWTIVASLFLACILLSIAARADWRRLSLSAHVGI
jgi:hypothetical protein